MRLMKAGEKASSGAVHLKAGSIGQAILVAPSMDAQERVAVCHFGAELMIKTARLKRKQSAPTQSQNTVVRDDVNQHCGCADSEQCGPSDSRKSLPRSYSDSGLDHGPLSRAERKERHLWKYPNKRSHSLATTSSGASNGLTSSKFLKLKYFSK